MTMLKKVVHAMLEYHHNSIDRIWESIEQLDPEQFVADNQYSRGSLRDQMVHLAATDMRWRMALEGDPDAREFGLETENYPSVEAAREVWEQAARALRQHVASLHEEALTEPAPNLPGPSWQVLLHIVNHGTDHRAQLLHALHDFGAPTFEQDLIYHFWPE